MYRYLTFRRLRGGDDAHLPNELQVRAICAEIPPYSRVLTTCAVGQQT